MARWKLSKNLIVSLPVGAPNDSCITDAIGARSTFKAVPITAPALHGTVAIRATHDPDRDDSGQYSCSKIEDAGSGEQ